MSVLDRIKAAYNALTTTPSQEIKVYGEGSLTSPNTSLAYALGMWPSSTGVPVSPLASLQASTVYACVRRLSEDLATRPILMKRRSGKGGWRDVDHPLLDLLTKPNNWQTQYGLISYMVTSLQLRGNGYIYTRRRGDGTPKELLPIMPDRTAILQNENGNIYYSISDPHFGAEVMYTNPDDLIHVRNISLDGGVLGVSPIACSQDSIGLALATQRNGCLFFRQGSNVGGVIECPSRLSPEAAMRIAQSWSSTYSGSDNAHRVAVLEENCKFSPIQINPTDAQLLETQKWSAEQICRVFGVLPWMVGLPVPTGTYSNVEQSSLQYITMTLGNLAIKVEQELERVLLFDDERREYRIVFDLDSMARGDMKSRFEAYQLGLLNGWLSIDEVRAREGLEGIPGGDQHRVPLNTGPAANKPTDTSPEGAINGNSEQLVAA